MIEAGASANFTKIAEVDKANTPKNNNAYEINGDFNRVPPVCFVYNNEINTIFMYKTKYRIFIVFKKVRNLNCLVDNNSETNHI